MPEQFFCRRVSNASRGGGSIVTVAGRASINPAEVAGLPAPVEMPSANHEMIYSDARIARS